MHTKNLQVIEITSIFSRITLHLINRRWWYMVLILLLTIFFFVQMSKLRFDNSSDIWFVQGHHALQAKKRFNEVFGNDELAYLLFTKETTPFTPKNLRLMAELVEAFEDGVRYLKKVIWLGNAERIRGISNQHIEIEPFLANYPITSDDVEEKLTEALTEPSFVGDFISGDKTALPMIIEFENYPPKEEDLTPQQTIFTAINTILNQPRFAALKPYIGGAPYFNIGYNKLVKRDMQRLLGLVILVQMVLLFFFARGWRGVVVPLSITVVAVSWTMGTIGFFGITLNLLSSALPTMLVCVSIGDAMHVISAFYGGLERGLLFRESLAAAFKEVGTALLLTSLTTAIGFLAYLSCDIVPYREMGVYVAVGVIYAVILTFILTPIFYSFDQNKVTKRNDKTTEDKFSLWLNLCFLMVIRYPKSIVLFFSVVMLVTFIGYLNVQVESSTNKLIFKGEPLRDTFDLIDQRMGNTSTLEFLFDTKKESGIKNPEFLQKIESLMNAAETNPLVGKAVSITTILKQMRRALHNNDPSYYCLPESAEAVAQYLILYESAGGDMLDRQVGFLYDQLRVTIKSPSLDTADARRLLEDMENKIKELFGDHKGTVDVIISGGMSRYMELNDILFSGQRQSFLAALMVIAIVMMLVLRSVKLALLSMIPNIFPVFLTMGFLGLIGYYLDVITISYAAVIIGVAVDDTIHFFTRFRQEFQQRGKYKSALKATYLSVGRPLTQTTLVLVIGNSVLMFSSLLGMYKLGILFGIAFSAALFADLFFAPALILLLKPLGKEQQKIL